MASTFPAAIANEPPPLEGSSEDEDSEEFRSHGLKLDVPSGEPTPVSTPFKRPLNKSPDKTVSIETLEKASSPACPEDNSSSEEIYYSNDDECRIATEASVNGVDHDDTSSERDAKEENQYDSPLRETIPEEVGMQTNHCDSSTDINHIDSRISPSSQHHAETVTVQAKLEPENEVAEGENVHKLSEATETEGQESITNTEEIANENNKPATQEEENAEEEFLEFQAFEVGSLKEDEDNWRDAINGTIDRTDSVKPSPPIAADATVGLEQCDEDDDFGDEDDFGAFQSIPQPPQQEVNLVENKSEDIDDEDDFGDFAHPLVQAPPCKTIPPPTTIQSIAQTSEETIEDFADFQDCSFQSFSGPSFSRASSTASDVTLVANKIDSVIKSLFVIDSNLEGEINKPNSIDSEISLSGDSTWARVQDFEGSHGLMFKWLSSLTGKRLLRSLNINTSNIVYHEKWGTIEVPKFAASLVQSPLQPQSCNKLGSHAKSVEHPAIVNNNTIISDDHDKPPSISSEAQEILRQLPDLSYMRANTLVFPQTSPSGL